MFEACKVFKELSFMQANVNAKCKNWMESLVMVKEGSKVVKHFRADEATKKRKIKV